MNFPISNRWLQSLKPGDPVIITYIDENGRPSRFLLNGTVRELPVRSDGKRIVVRISYAMKDMQNRPEVPKDFRRRDGFALGVADYVGYAICDPARIEELKNES